MLVSSFFLSLEFSTYEMQSSGFTQCKPNEYDKRKKKKNGRNLLGEHLVAGDFSEVGELKV